MFDNVRALLSRSDLDINLESSFDEGKKVQSSLMTAIEKENIEIIQLLLLNPKIDLQRIIRSGYHVDNYSNSVFKFLMKSPKVDVNINKTESYHSFSSGESL